MRLHESSGSTEFRLSSYDSFNAFCKDVIAEAKKQGLKAEVNSFTFKHLVITGTENGGWYFEIIEEAHEICVDIESKAGSTNLYIAKKNFVIGFDSHLYVLDEENGNCTTCYL